jgi:hypothetical protein
MVKRNLYLAMLVFILADTAFSFIQHYHVNLDGDMPGIIMPSRGYSTVMQDPFGTAVILKDTSYPAPNRFFAHFTMSKYFKLVPGMLQAFMSPINSVYAACALAKTGIQLFIILLLATYISGRGKPGSKDFILAAVLVVPLFQASGYNVNMGIIDKSITYTFFYALPMSLLLLFFLPFFMATFHGRGFIFNLATRIGLLLLCVLISFNGPLGPGVILIVCPLVLLYRGWNNFKNQEGTFLQRKLKAIGKIPGDLLFYFIFISLLCLYSLYLGAHNSENLYNTIPVFERYLRIPGGLWDMLSQKLGIPLLIIIITVNAIIIRKNKDESGSKILFMLKWISLFAAIYILLLPFGGYRIYRPDTVRRDTMMPVILCLMFLYGISTYYLLNRSALKYKTIYAGAVIAFLLIFTLADANLKKERDCEKMALEEMANSPETIVHLKANCTVLAWEKIRDPKESALNGELLHTWGITKEKKLYYQD